MARFHSIRVIPCFLSYSILKYKMKRLNTIKQKLLDLPDALFRNSYIGIDDGSLLFSKSFVLSNSLLSAKN